MDKERWAEIQRVFDHLADKSPSHRSDYLDIVCEDDPPLRAEVERLLAAHDDLDEDEPIGLVGAPSGTAMPDRLGDYTLERLIGEGGMGSVYEATHPLHGRVAIKLLPAYLVENATAAKRFENEAAVLGRLRHAGLCRLFDSFVVDGRACIAMEYVRGEDLGSIIAAGPLDVARAAGIVRSLADALASAHAQSVFHRDIKPGNIIVPETRGEAAKLIDFGIAKFADVRLTATGQAVGSPRYMSPEQWLGGRIDERTDLWSLGVVWYEMLTARRPFDGKALAETAAAVLKADPVPLPATNVLGESLAASAAIIEGLLRKNLLERIGSCAELIGLIDRMIDAHSAPAGQS